MSFSIWHLVIVCVGYLSLLFAVAYATERGLVPLKIVRHPITYVLSLGVYASAWAFYGSVGLAYKYGYGFLAFYLGICGAFLLAPVLLMPLLRITKSYQLSSIADLFTFRYRSQWAGTLSTLLMMIGVLAMLALQFQAVIGTMDILAPGHDRAALGIIFCTLIILFTILFGARGQNRAERHPSLVVAVAFESLVKLIALSILGAYSVYKVFGGFDELDSWLQENAVRVSAMERHLEDGPWRAMLLTFFASAVVMPHMFHMTFTENLNPSALFKASWGLPLYLLLISLPVPIILWSGIRLAVPTPPEFFALGIGMSLNAPWLTLLTYIGGLAAASGVLIVTTLALASMALNHLILPLYQPLAKDNIYNWLNWVRRVLIVCILISGYVAAIVLGERYTLSDLGILAFSAALQFLPGVLAVIYWPIGNRLGFISGLIAGMSLWLVTISLPILFEFNIFAYMPWSEVYALSRDHLDYYVTASLSVNIVVFVIVSLFTRASKAELSAAQACSVDALMRPSRRELVATSSEQFKEFLTEPLGEHTAQREVNRAIAQLQLEEIEYRPYALRRLRDQIEANLSGLLGPALAQDIVIRTLGFKPAGNVTPAEDIYFVESKLEEYNTQLTGLAAELDSLRRYHRQTLQNLPIAACSLGVDLEVLMWNNAMETLTGINAPQVIGSHISTIPGPWSNMLFTFAHEKQGHIAKHRIDIKGRPHWFNLHKAAIDTDEQGPAGQVLLIEDYTDTQLLEEELIHSERLASVGRLAAGVAHEIGNPITGVACLAQNMKLMTENQEVLETADQILTQTQRVSRILQSLMNFSRSGNHSSPNQHQSMPLSKCINEAIHLLSLSASNPQVKYINEVPDDIFLFGDDQRMLQVFVNLLSNARDASKEFGRIWVSAKVVENVASIEIVDEGSGISSDQQDHLFEPFFTTKGPDRGTGLGLALVYSIVEEHYGRIRIESPADKVRQCGARVILDIPAHMPEHQFNTAEVSE